MTFNLKHKTAIITGASGGLGEQFARSLSGAGARVILAARRLEKLNTLAAELTMLRPFKWMYPINIPYQVALLA